MSKKPTRYAEGTTTSIENSKAEIERTLRRYGVTSSAFMSTPTSGAVVFEAVGCRIRFDVPQGRDEKENKRQWRVALLRIKTRLEEAASTGEPLQSVFLSNIVLPDGSTVGQKLLPELIEVAKGKPLPPLLGY